MPTIMHFLPMERVMTSGFLRRAGRGAPAKQKPQARAGSAPPRRERTRSALEVRPREDNEARQTRGLPGSCATLVHVPRSLTSMEPLRRTFRAEPRNWRSDVAFRQKTRRRPPSLRGFRGSITRPMHPLSTLRSHGRPCTSSRPRKTRCRLVGQPCRSGLSPAGCFVRFPSPTWLPPHPGFAWRTYFATSARLPFWPVTPRNAPTKRGDIANMNGRPRSRSSRTASPRRHACGARLGGLLSPPRSHRERVGRGVVEMHLAAERDPVSTATMASAHRFGHTMVLLVWGLTSCL
jgi:hypothetical protein